MSQRPAIKITAEEAAAKAYAWTKAKPENAGMTPSQLAPLAKELLRGMIRKGLFEII